MLAAHPRSSGDPEETAPLGRGLLSGPWLQAEPTQPSVRGSELQGRASRRSGGGSDQLPRPGRLVLTGLAKFLSKETMAAGVYPCLHTHTHTHTHTHRRAARPPAPGAGAPPADRGSQRESGLLRINQK